MGLTQVNTDGVKDDAVTLAKQAAGTDGQVITYDASGNPVAVGPGTDGQVLTSTGAGSPPAFEDAVSEGTQVKSTGESGGTKFLREDGDGTCSWQTVSAGTALTGSTDNTICTVTGANAIQGEANLTFDGHHLTQTIDANAEGFNQTAAGAHYIDNTAEANLSSGDNPILRTTATWNGTTVAQVKYMAGTDTTNKDDGYITFNTSAADNLSEKMRIQSDGNVKINDGNLVIGTSGHGIDFSADGDSTNASGTATGHLLHDYEEGTFDPEYRTGVTSYNTRSGHYTKVGRVVHYQIYVNATLDSTSSSSYAIVKGLPFTCDSNTHISSSGCIGWWYGLGEDVTHGYVGNNSTEVVLLGENHAGSRDHVSHNDVFQGQASARICISGSYITAA